MLLLSQIKSCSDKSSSDLINDEQRYAVPHITEQHYCLSIRKGIIKQNEKIQNWLKAQHKCNDNICFVCLRWITQTNSFIAVFITTSFYVPTKYLIMTRNIGLTYQQILCEMSTNFLLFLGLLHFNHTFIDLLFCAFDLKIILNENIFNILGNYYVISNDIQILRRKFTSVNLRSIKSLKSNVK